MTYDERLAQFNLHCLECRRLYLDALFLGKLKFHIIHLSLHDLQRKIPLCIITALPNCLLLIASHFISSLFALYAYGIVCTMILLLRIIFALFAVFCIMLILYHICGGVFNGSYRAFTLPLCQHLLVHLSLHEINK